MYLHNTRKKKGYHFNCAIGAHILVGHEFHHYQLD